MTVYVDDMRMRARVGRLDARWSHLMVGPGDELGELHEFARGIGLRRSWFQGPPKHRHPHYDVTDTLRRRAIEAGAKAITWREAGLMLAGGRSGPAAQMTLTEEADRWVASEELLPPQPPPAPEGQRSLFDDLESA